MTSCDHATRVFLGLSQVHGVGFKLLRDIGGVSGVESMLEMFELWPFFSSLVNKSEEELRDEVEFAGEVLAAGLEDRVVQILREDSELFPPAFSGLDQGLRPKWIFVQGRVDLLYTPSVAVVGTRDPTETGSFLARYAVSLATELQLPVVSGLAKGIDAVAHEWAIESGIPNISVLGTGILRTYPSRHANLAGKIVDRGGVLISEYLPDAAPSSENFIWRNRLQAALAGCVIAPEWKRLSGTAHTVRYAKSFGRPTINLIAQGVQVASNHGEAGMTFTVPTEHSALRQVVMEACGRQVAKPVRQASLFG